MTILISLRRNKFTKLSLKKNMRQQERMNTHTPSLCQWSSEAYKLFIQKHEIPSTNLCRLFTQKNFIQTYIFKIVFGRCNKNSIQWSIRASQIIHWLHTRHIIWSNILDLSADFSHAALGVPCYLCACFRVVPFPLKLPFFCSKSLQVIPSDNIIILLNK